MDRKIRQVSILFVAAGSLFLTAGCQLKREVKTDDFV